MHTHQDYSKAALRITSGLSLDSITITSETGVGSSTTIKQFRESYGHFGWRCMSAGDMMRVLAAENNMTIEEFAAHNRAHPEEKWDERLDQAIVKYGQEHQILIEGRLPHVFVPHGFHVRLICSVSTRAQRRHKDFPGLTLQEVEDRIRKRDEDDNERYRLLYPGCLWPNTDFDLVLDTEENSPEALVWLIAEGHDAWKQRQMG